MALIHKLNFISGSSTSFKDTRLQTSLDEGFTHGNGLGVGWSANMGDFNPFLWNVLRVHRNVSDATWHENFLVNFNNKIVKIKEWIKLFFLNFNSVYGKVLWHWKVVFTLWGVNFNFALPGHQTNKNLSYLLYILTGLWVLCTPNPDWNMLFKRFL